MIEYDIERQAILTRAACVEAQRQAALQANDWQAVREFETELSRLHSRYRDLEVRQGRRESAA
jgi:hypothetical protein